MVQARIGAKPIPPQNGNGDVWQVCDDHENSGSGKPELKLGVFDAVDKTGKTGMEECSRRTMSQGYK